MLHQVCFQASPKAKQRADGFEDLCSASFGLVGVSGSQIPRGYPVHHGARDGTRVFFFAVVALCWFLLSLRGPRKPASE